MTPYQVVLGQKWKNRTARLRDILPFSQGHALKHVVQLRDHAASFLKVCGMKFWNVYFWALGED